MHKLSLFVSLLSVTACATDSLVDWQEVAPVDIDAAFASGQVSNIVGGAAHTGNPEVGFLALLDANSNLIASCSGTLVAPRVLMTAAHCVDGKEVQPAGFGAYFGTTLQSSPDPGFVIAALAEKVAFHPDWNPADVTQGNDIAVVLLDRDIPITPKRVRTSPLGAAEKGADIELIGWGITGSGKEDQGLKRRVVSQLTDFDAKLVLVGNSKTNVCSGDSGGPAFLGDRVIGVTSFGDVDCTKIGIDTRVDVFLDFLGAAGVDVTPDPAPPQPPPQPAPPDPTCTNVFGCDGETPNTGAKDGGGCSAGGGSGNLAALGVVLALISAGRRRRRSCR